MDKLKRYKNNEQWEQEYFPQSQRYMLSCVSSMHESASGEWVRYEDAERLLEEVKAEHPDYKLKKQLVSIQKGNCIECGAKIKGYETPMGSFAPEAWAHMRERGLDPSTGHRKDCSLK